MGLRVPIDWRAGRGAALWAAALFLFIADPAETVATQIVNRSFEQGNLNGWDYYGDASAQTAALGVSPTHGEYAALLAAVADSYYYPRYATSYGGGNLLEFLGLSPGDLQALRDWSFDHQGLAPCIATFSYCGLFDDSAGGSAIHQSVDLRAGQVVSFDWMRVGDILDHAYGLFYQTGGPFWSGAYTYADLEAPFIYPNTMDPWYGPYDGWTQYSTGWQSYSFVAPTDGNYTLVLGDFSRYDSGWTSALWLDNFKISQVPEPSALTLIITGLAGLAAVACSRRRTH